MVRSVRVTLRACVLLLAGAAALVPVTPAAAEFATECANPTRVISASSTEALTLTSTDVVLFSAGTFTGGLNDLPNGSIICVGAGAVFLPQYVNNAAGRLLNAGTATMPAFASGAGASVENSGTLNFPQGVNNNGPATVVNLGSGTITVGVSLSLGTGAAITNAGTITVAGGVNFNSGTSLTNTGDVTITGPVNVNGDLNNQGFLTTGALTFNGGSSLSNSCVVTATQLILNAAGVNNGHVDVGTGAMTINGGGTFTQSAAGYTTGGAFANNGTVTGFGAYQFAGATLNNATFTGDSASLPIVFNDLSPTGAQIFDTQNGTVTNTVGGPVRLPGTAVVPAGCAQAPVPSTDIAATKTGPAQTTAGSRITYVLTLTNSTAVPAAAVVVSDTFSTSLTSVVTSPPADSLAGGTARWSIGTLGANETRIFTVTGTAPASGTVTDVVSATTSTADAQPSNNDGSLPSAQASTEVVLLLPPNNPPVVGNVAVTTVANIPVGGAVPTADPDPGQTVTDVLSPVPANQPAHGTVLVDPSGAFLYSPDTGFVGRDSFVVVGCDDGSPVACDNGTVSVTVTPAALPDLAATFEGVSAEIDVRLNDIGTTGLPVLTAAPTNGTATVGPTGLVTYTPNPGFTGVDTLRYRVCGVTDPDLCDSAQVIINVEAPLQPPTVPDAAAEVAVGGVTTGQLVSTSPDAATVVNRLGTQLIPGDVTVNADGSFRYAATTAFTGVGTFTVIGCAVSTQLCDIGTVTVTVFPLAAPDHATTAPGTGVDIAVAANDRGTVGPPVPGTPAHGTAVAGPGGVIRYTPEPGFTGTDQFSYTVCSLVTPTVCATTTVTVTVLAALPGPPGGPGGPGILPVTGASTGPAAGGALLLLLGGALLTISGRPRGARVRQHPGRTP